MMNRSKRAVGVGLGILIAGMFAGCGGLAGKPAKPAPIQGKRRATHRVQGAPRSRIRGSRSLPGTTPGKLEVMAYYATGKHMNLSALWKYPRAISVFSPFLYSVDSSGALVTHHKVAAALAAVVKHGIPVEPLVNDATGVQAFLSAPATRVAAARNVADMVRAGGYQGVGIDFEPPNTAARHELVEFITELRDRLPTKDVISLAIVPHSRGAYDLKALGPEVNQFVLMSYDEHAAGTGPGPVASAIWVKNILARTERSIPPAKILLGVPLYGYVWPKGSTQAITIPYASIPAVVKAHARWDAAAQGLHSTYTASGTSYVAWWTNLRSMQDSLRLARRNKLAGVALWRLGYQNDRVMQLLLKTIGPQH